MSDTHHPKYCILDFDGTLYSGNSFIDFAIFTKGRMGYTKALIKSLPWIISWKLNICTNSIAKQKLFCHLFGGMGVDTFNSFCYDFSKIIQSKVNKYLLKEVESLISEGFTPIIATASIESWVKPWAEEIGIKNVVATMIEVKSNKVTGLFATPNCYGEEKVKRVLLCKPNLQTAYTVFYTDSITADAPLISITSKHFIIKKGTIK